MHQTLICNYIFKHSVICFLSIMLCHNHQCVKLSFSMFSSREYQFDAEGIAIWFLCFQILLLGCLHAYHPVEMLVHLSNYVSLKSCIIPLRLQFYKCLKSWVLLSLSPIANCCDWPVCRFAFVCSKESYQMLKLIHYSYIIFFKSDHCYTVKLAFIAPRYTRVIPATYAGPG